MSKIKLYIRIYTVYTNKALLVSERERVAEDDQNKRSKIIITIYNNNNNNHNNKN